MVDQRFFSIFDLGSSKIRIGVFDDALPKTLNTGLVYEFLKIT